MYLKLSTKFMKLNLNYNWISENSMHYYNKMSECQTESYPMIRLVCRILKKNDTSELIYKTETDSQT